MSLLFDHWLSVRFEDLQFAFTDKTTLSLETNRNFATLGVINVHLNLFDVAVLSIRTAQQSAHEMALISHDNDVIQA